MKKLLIVFVALCAVECFAADEKPKRSREYIERRKLEHFGGFIYQPVETKKISIVDESGMGLHSRSVSDEAVYG